MPRRVRDGEDVRDVRRSAGVRMVPRQRNVPRGGRRRHTTQRPRVSRGDVRDGRGEVRRGRVVSGGGERGGHAGRDGIRTRDGVLRRKGHVRSRHGSMRVPSRMGRRGVRRAMPGRGGTVREQRLVRRGERAVPLQTRIRG